MKTSLQSINLKHFNLARCNIWNSLHETNGKYENLNSMKLQVHYYHTICCSYLVCIHEYFTAPASHLKISKHEAILKHENFTLYSIISQLHHIITTKNL